MIDLSLEGYFVAIKETKGKEFTRVRWSVAADIEIISEKKPVTAKLSRFEILTPVGSSN